MLEKDVAMTTFHSQLDSIDVDRFAVLLAHCVGCGGACIVMVTAHLLNLIIDSRLLFLWSYNICSYSNCSCGNCSYDNCSNVYDIPSVLVMVCYVSCVLW